MKGAQQMVCSGYEPRTTGDDGRNAKVGKVPSMLAIRTL